METLSNKLVIERSSLFLDLSQGLLNKIDLFLSNTNLSNDAQDYLMQLMQEVYSEGYTNSLTD